MKERGLICKDDEVSAILDGRKTVMRRPVTSMNGFGRITRVSEGSRGYSVACTDTKGVVHDIAYHEACDHGPFGVPGDRLWVKEIYKVRIAHHFEYEAGGEPLVVPGSRVPGRWSLPAWYESVASERSANSMPRWASRILLEVVSVRIERLHAITEEDARREGMGRDGVLATGSSRTYFRSAFENTWGRHYTKRHAWAENPFVWRVEFRRVP